MNPANLVDVDPFPPGNPFGDGAPVLLAGARRELLGGQILGGDGLKAVRHGDDSRLSAHDSFPSSANR
ncbi:hypothetical protein [Bythopirellula goksoeyrii]|uniref:Uncharacterized protein n=1 Tax=Bythopirellula goksoeyrii TaxID=1400387 RepID=A0A5B9Q6X8_9BACT|nr:hypothetical protein [Bythopirellula goksoeyrii]QEG34737.1 hypothetical protein Pr1d_20190 [Bythopirellula goksoeyrii]